MKNPIFNYYGGKFSIAKWIISHFPDKKFYNTYGEPYTGGASVAMQTETVGHNYLNDKDNRLVNFLQLVRDEEKARQLTELLLLTPYGREEYRRCLEPSPDPLEDARRLFVILNQGRKGTSTTTTKQWKRSKTSNTGVNNAFYNKARQLKEVCYKLQNFYIENQPALNLIRDLDQPSTLFYIDPPYLPKTRVKKNMYHTEMTKEDHIELLELIITLSSFVVISGYDSDLYNNMLPNWHKFTTKARTLGDPSNSTNEFIWCNYDPKEYQKQENKTMVLL